MAGHVRVWLAPGMLMQGGVATGAGCEGKRERRENKVDAREWYMGRDVRPEGQNGQGEVIVRYGNDVIGLGKWVGNRVKNGLPRELVRDKNLF